MNYPSLAPSPFCLYNIPMSGCRTGFPQHYPPLPKTQNPAKKNIREGVDMIATSAIIYSFILFQHKTACSHLSFCYNNSETAGANALWKKILTS